MTNNFLEKIASEVEKIAEKSRAEAEMALERIASDKGDDFVASVITQMSPLKVAEIVREYDFSVPSIICWLTTPEQVVELFSLDPLYWEKALKLEKREKFYEIRENALSLVSSILFQKSGRERRKAILEAVSENEESFLYLAMPFIGWQPSEESEIVIEDSQFEIGSPDHIFEEIRWAAPNVAEKILDFINSGGNDLVNSIIDLQLEAEEKIGETETGSVEDAGFVPLE